MSKEKKNYYDIVYAIVKQIPKGKVSTYGRIASLAGSPRAARATGYALFHLNENDAHNIPWQRVVNAQGQISFKGDLIRASLQKKMLEQEGIFFKNNDAIDLQQFGWP